MPATAKDSKGLLKAAIRDDSPVIFIENRNLYYENEAVPEGEFIIPIGQGEIVQSGTELTLVAIAYSRHKVLKALELTDASVDLIDPRTVAPLDMPLILDSLARTGKLLVVQEANAQCGIGAEIIRRVVEEGFDYLDCPPVLMGGKHIPTPFSPPLEDYILPQVEDISKKITAIAQNKI